VLNTTDMHFGVCYSLTTLFILSMDTPGLFAEVFVNIKPGVFITMEVGLTMQS